LWEEKSLLKYIILMKGSINMKAIFKKLTGIPVMCAMLAMSGNSFPNSSKWLCPIIPKPSKVELGDGSFTLSKKTQIVVLNGKAGLQRIGKECSRQLHQLTGLVLPFKKAVNLGKIKNAIVLELNAADTSLGKEGYRLSVEPSRITIKARTEAGVFYGMQSLLQVTISDEVTRAQEIKIPAFRIEDQPRFEWRGMHLDVSRHFFPKQFIKTYIDMLAMHKMNVFHWHLTDDQGWRIEIKRYPKLAKIAAWRVDREDQYWSSRAPQREGEKATYGGYYTQKEIKEIVRYAKSRFITVVPEIEMPAHTTAALAAYPIRADPSLCHPVAYGRSQTSTARATMKHSNFWRIF
jgi:hexosaminidase